MPIIDARSKMPPRPNPVLSTTRPMSSPNLSSLPCSRSLTAETRSSTLLKTFETAVRIGTAARRRRRPAPPASPPRCRRHRAPGTSRDSIGSNGSSFDGPSAQPARRRRPPGPPARGSAPEMQRDEHDRSLSASRRGLVEQELSDQLLEDDPRLGLRHRAAIREHLRVATRVEPDVDVAEQALTSGSKRSCRP